MIVNGWALADHSSLHADEIIARENRRGLWRGRFVHPDTWRAGVRLPGEPPPPRLADAAQAERLIRNHGTDEVALPLIISRIVTDVPTLRRVSFPLGGRLTDEGLAQLSQLARLEVLDIANCGEITSAGLAHLKKLPHLKQLALPYSTTDAGLAPLEGLTELESLTISHYRADPITDAGLARLKGLRRLRHLLLNDLQTTDAGLANLCGLQELRILEFGRVPVGDAGLVHLGKLQNLQYLDIGASEVTDAGVDHLFGLKDLRILKIPDRITRQARQRLQAAIPELQFDGRPEETEGLQCSTSLSPRCTRSPTTARANRSGASSRCRALIFSTAIGRPARCPETAAQPGTRSRNGLPLPLRPRARERA
jgi:hypothetical protein